MTQKICASCGGKFKDTLAKCPYCGTLNYKGAEREYLDKLEGIRRDVADLGSVPDRETKKEMKRQMRFVMTVLLPVILIVLAVSGIFRLSGNHGQSDAGEDFAAGAWNDAPEELKENYLWELECYPIWDEYYEEGRYEELVQAYDAAVEEGRQPYTYKHYYFMRALKNVDSVHRMLQEEEEGTLSQENYAALLHYEWYLKYMTHCEWIEDEERERLLPFIQEAVADFDARWDMSDEDIQSFEEEISSLRYVPYEKCEEYAGEWYQRRVEQ